MNETFRQYVEALPPRLSASSLARRSSTPTAQIILLSVEADDWLPAGKRDATSAIHEKSLVQLAASGCPSHDRVAT
jgi:hypothetical protein